MARLHHISVPYGALISVFLALAIGSAPVAVLIALHDRLTVLP